jgi:hypothetical protein
MEQFEIVCNVECFGIESASTKESHAKRKFSGVTFFARQFRYFECASRHGYAAQIKNISKVGEFL